MRHEGPSLAAALSERKGAILDKWLQQMLQTWPEASVKFLSQQRDPFRNPVGNRLKEGLSTLFDSLVRPANIPAAQSALDDILRIRAVQDISAGQAVAFIFLIKRIIRAELAADSARFQDEFTALEIRADEMVLSAFDLFMKCRERIYEIKANEARRMAFLHERIHLKETSTPVDDPVNEAR